MSNVNIHVDTSEIDAFAKILKEHKNSAVLLDSYFITPLYLNAISKLAKIAYIDDISAFCYELDLLINYSAFLDFDAYKKGKKPDRYHTKQFKEAAEQNIKAAAEHACPIFTIFIGVFDIFKTSIKAFAASRLPP